MLLLTFSHLSLEPMYSYVCWCVPRSKIVLFDSVKLSKIGLPLAMFENSICIISLSTLRIVSLFHYSNSGEYVVVSHIVLFHIYWWLIRLSKWSINIYWSFYTVCEFPVKVFCPFSLGWLYIIELWVFRVHSGNDYSIVLGLSSPVGWLVFSLTRVFW